MAIWFDCRIECMKIFCIKISSILNNSHCLRLSSSEITTLSRVKGWNHLQQTLIFHFMLSFIRNGYVIHLIQSTIFFENKKSHSKFYNQIYKCKIWSNRTRQRHRAQREIIKKNCDNHGNGDSTYTSYTTHNNIRTNEAFISEWQTNRTKVIKYDMIWVSGT